jgi:glycosyltransferase involved in cell wall biosynthesis
MAETTRILFFTSDPPLLDGPGKNIRVLYWLHTLAGQYQEVICVLMMAKPPMVDWIYHYLPNVKIYPIDQAVNRMNIGHRWAKTLAAFLFPWRFNPAFSLQWPTKDQSWVKVLLQQPSEILIFRSYMMPMAKEIKKYLPQNKKMAIDLDDADLDILPEIAISQKKRREMRSWFTTRALIHAISVYESKLPVWIHTIYYANPGNQNYFQSRFPTIDRICFPNKIPAIPKAINLPASSIVTPPVILFTGTLNYLPNVEAVTWLVQYIWPVLKKKHPNARLLIAGKNPSQSLQNTIRQIPGIELVQNPVHTDTLFGSARVFVVPLWKGSGTRIKILQAWYHRLPVVSTSIGIEGLGAQHGKEVLIADDPDTMIQSISQLLQNEKLAADIALHGKKLLDQCFLFDLETIRPADGKSVHSNS